MFAFKVEPLVVDWVDRAFALVQLCEPDLAMEQWRRYVQIHGQSDGSSGICAIIGSDDYLYGLFSFACGTELRYGRVLRIDLCVLPTLMPSKGLERLVFDSIQQIAERLSCHTVGIRRPHGADHVDPKIGSPGFRRGRRAHQTHRMWFDLPLSDAVPLELIRQPA